MTETRYVTGVIIANGIPDSQGDILNRKEIKTIFTKYINRDTDIMHNRIKNEGVEVLANWINETDTVIGNKTVPAGSWMATTKVINEDIIKLLDTGEINGYSLGSTTDEGKNPHYWLINKYKTYKDLEDIEDVNPLFISFVDEGANEFPLEILNQDSYINKSKFGEKMSEKDETKEVMVPLSAIDKIKDLFMNKSKEPEDIEEETEPEDISNTELLEKIAEVNKNAFKEALSEILLEKEKKEEEEEKEEDNEEDNEEEGEETSSEKEDETTINKRHTMHTESVFEPETTDDFYPRTKRDHLGRKLR